MRRLFTLVVLLGMAIPAGISLDGCTRNPGQNYCNGLGYGLKTTDIASMTLQPQTAGISLAYGQTTQAQTPTAQTCKGDAFTLNGGITYGTTNNQIVDISTSGAICAGTWNRNTGGGIADYTVCSPPKPLPATGGLPYAVAYITASADSITSNPVAVYVHAPITSVSLVGPQQCVSQTLTAQLDAEACYAVNGTQYELCAPSSVTSTGKYSCPGGLASGVTSVPSCGSSIGTMNFSVATSSVASINATTNQITASQPGTTAITASIAQTASSAGYFSTCPPASISVTMPDGTTSGTVTQGSPQNVATTAIDTNGKTLTGLSLTYQSTNPIDISSNATGGITTSYPGVGTITAVCQAPDCNPAPINQVGLYGTGLPITSNPVNITVPGTASDFVWFAAPGVSRYFVPIQLLTGTMGSTVRLPYVPNSMVMDRKGNSLYFGSARELMIYSTQNNNLGTEVTGAPGVVLAVAPDNSAVLVNDQTRQLFYLYTVDGGTITSFPGMGNAAAWTPDAKTLYVTDNAQLNTPAGCGTLNITGHSDTLYVYNASLGGWSTYALPPSPLPASQIPSCTDKPNVMAPLQYQTPAIMNPSVGAYLRGTTTLAHTWCPTGTVGNQATIKYFPLGDTVAVQSDVLSSTLDGSHILSAVWSAGGITLNDIAVTVPGQTLSGNSFSTPNACSVTVGSSGAQTMNPLLLTSTVQLSTLLPVNATSVNQVITGATPVPSSGGVGKSLAFVTYSGTTAGAGLPFYLPASSGPGTPGTVTLTGSSSITAPVAGVFSPDNTLFFVSTAGDNKIHYISIPNAISTSSQPTDSKQVSPNLPACSVSSDTGCVYNGTDSVVPATAIVVKPRSTT